MSPPGLPPGPSAPALWQALRLSRDPIATLTDARERYGDVFTLRLWRVGEQVVVAAPAALGALLAADPALARAGAARRRLLPVLPPGSALGADGDAHRLARARLLPVLSAARLEPLVPRMAQIATEHADRWPVGRAFSLLGRARALALDAFVREVLAVRDRRRAQALVRAVLRMLWSPVVAPGLWMPDPRGGPAVRAGWSLHRALRHPVDRVVRAELVARRADRGCGPDVFGALLGTDPAIDEQVIVDEVVGLLIAAVEPIGAGLTWMLERLTHHPETADRIRRGPGAGDPLLRAVILETLHTRPAIIDAARELAAPVVLGGRTVPAGTSVVVAIPLVHAPAAVSDPREFRPQRWLEGEAPARSIPFGGGERTCLGAALTMVEARAVVPAVLERLGLVPAGAPERAALRGTALVPAVESSPSVRQPQNGRASARRPGGKPRPYPTTRSRRCPVRVP